MSFLAKLFLFGRERNVLNTNVHFYCRLHSSTNQPTTLPMGGMFTVTLEADGTTDLLHLGTSNDRQCNGYIRLYKYDGLSKLYDYEFFDTYVVGYHKEFDASGGKSARITVTFSPGILRIGDMVFEKPWKTTDLKEKEAMAKVPAAQEKKPEVKDYFITDVEGNRIEKTKIGETIILNIHTQDMKGETMTISLPDPTVDFMYNGTVLVNDMLEDILISGNKTKIELEVVAQKKE